MFLKLFDDLLTFFDVAPFRWPLLRSADKSVPLSTILSVATPAERRGEKICFLHKFLAVKHF